MVGGTTHRTQIPHYRQERMGIAYNQRDNIARPVMAKSSVKFKDTIAQFEQLKDQIAKRAFAPIYLLMGEESYFIDALSEALSTTILTPAEQAFNQITVYGKDSDAGQIVNLCRQMPMMGSYEVIILKEAQQLRNIEKLSAYTQKPQPSTILIICHKEKNLDKRSSLYKQCSSSGVVFESVRPRDYEIGPWLNSFVKEPNLKHISFQKYRQKLYA